MSSEAHATEPADPLVIQKPFFSRTSGKIFIIWAVMTAAGVLIGFYVPHHILPTFLSKEGSDVWATIVLFTVAAAPVAALVYAIAVYSLLAWRHRGDQDEPPADGPPLRGNNGVVTLWLGGSFVLVLGLLAWGLSIYYSDDATPRNALQVDVIGQQWLWTFRYPGTNIETRTLVLPVDRPVEFNVTSEDVTHGFWPVSLGIQVDANPGVTTVIDANPNKLGSFVVRCSQLCGLYHSFMYAPGSVVTSAAFSRWLQSQGATAAQANQLARVSA
jgi:cytochrome c oxidase subunit 2